MTDTSKNYGPRPLATAREYPGYQFFARLALKGRGAGDCLRCAALTMQNWLCERIQKADGGVPEEIRCAPAQRYMETDDSALKSFRLPVAEVVFLPEQGIWAMMVREPDPDTAGRAFVTHAALRVKGEDQVAFGVRVDIEDRGRDLEELDRAYRPQFVRLFFETEGMTLTQSEPLTFRKAIQISDRKGVSRLKALYNDRENQLPLIVFTHAKRSPAVDPEALKVDLPKRPLWAGAGPLPPTPPPVGKPSAFMPWNAEEFAKHSYGFARVYVASAEAFGELKARFGKVSLGEGDILVAEPKAFGGHLRALPYRPDLGSLWYRGITDELQEWTQRYSKHKPFSYGDLLFVDDARQLLRSQELEALRASIHLEKSEEIQGLLELLESQRQTSEEQLQHISDLRAQMRQEYARGEANERQRAQQLQDQLDRLKAENAQLRASNESMRKSYAASEEQKEIARRAQSLSVMPRTNADVTAWFEQMFSDRLAFTERGRKAAAKCDIRPEVLWTCLYHIASVLADLYRSRVPDVEKAFKRRTGWELAASEGAMTRKDSDYMNLRRDSYEGREISIEPHIKFPRSEKKTGANYQRLYYAYDDLSGKIIVGYVGDHLENYSSLGFH